MAFVHSKDGFLSIDGNNLSAFTDSCSWEDTTDTHDVTCFGATRKAFKTGLGDGTATISGTYDDTSAGPKAILEALKDAGAAVTLIRRAEGTGAGKPQESVSVLIGKYTETLAVADMIKWSCDLQMTGTLTRSTQA